MATILACIRASPLALRPLRPLAGIRSYSDKKDDDEAGSSLDKKKKKSLEDLLRGIKIEKPVEPIELRSVKRPRRAPGKVPDLDKRTLRLAQTAAECLPGDAGQNLDELLGQLREVSKESKENLEDLLVGMRIDRSEKDPRVSALDRRIMNADAVDEQSRYIREAKIARAPRTRVKNGKMQDTFKFFSGPRLGIFSADAPRSGCSLPVWDQLQKEELKILLTTSPWNGFAEMRRWTEEGKLWPFPINNEHGMLEEANVSFEDHVFLDHLIEDDHAFPPGPVKQFMELVCVGLSKNPYISVERKHRCIEWYRDYLTSKKKLIEASLES